MLKPNDQIINVDSSPNSRKRKQVTFTSSALEMAEKHESEPSVQKLGEFRKRVDVGSASSWEAFSIGLFGADFEKDIYDELPSVIFEYYQTDAVLQERLRVMRDAALQITRDDFETHGSEMFDDKTYKSPLKITFRILGEILVGSSQEEMLREAARVKEVREVKAAKEKKSSVIHAALSTDDIHSISSPRQPSTLPTTPQKRNVSDTSFGTRSTDTTPTKLIKPESSIQDLQNTLVREVHEAIYHAAVIRMPWPRGRTNMRLVYQPSCQTYFKCRLDDNKTDKLDSVTAIADGAFVIHSDKVHNSEKSGLWSRQKACLLFEAKRLDTTPEQIQSAGPTQIANAETQKRAAQILAEMLGLVCHREYIKCGDQTVFVIHIAGVEVSIYWADFPVRYLDIIRNHNVRDLKNIPKVTLHHTRPQSLIDPDERDRFLRDYVSVVHFVASGYGNVGFLRRDVDTPIHRDVDDVVNSESTAKSDDAYIAD